MMQLTSWYQKHLLMKNQNLIISSSSHSLECYALYPIYPTPPLGQDMTQGQFLSGIQSFPSPRLVASPRLKNPVCPYYLPIAGGRIIGFIPFQGY